MKIIVIIYLNRLLEDLIEDSMFLLTFPLRLSSEGFNAEKNVFIFFSHSSQLVCENILAH